jgi:hypothetical protein
MDVQETEVTNWQLVGATWEYLKKQEDQHQLGEQRVAALTLLVSSLVEKNVPTTQLVEAEDALCALNIYLSDSNRWGKKSLMAKLLLDRLLPRCVVGGRLPGVSDVANVVTIYMICNHQIQVIVEAAAAAASATAARNKSGKWDSLATKVLQAIKVYASKVVPAGVAMEAAQDKINVVAEKVQEEQHVAHLENVGPSGFICGGGGGGGFTLSGSTLNDFSKHGGASYQTLQTTFPFVSSQSSSLPMEMNGSKFTGSDFNQNHLCAELTSSTASLGCAAAFSNPTLAHSSLPTASPSLPTASPLKKVKIEGEQQEDEELEAVLECPKSLLTETPSLPTESLLKNGMIEIDQNGDDELEKHLGHPTSLTSLEYQEKIDVLAAIARTIVNGACVVRFFGPIQEFQPEEFYFSLPESIINSMDMFFHLENNDTTYYRWEGAQVRTCVIPLPKEVRQVLLNWLDTNKVPYQQNCVIGQLVLRTQSQTKHKDNTSITNLWVCDLSYVGCPLGTDGRLQYQVMV